MKIYTTVEPVPSRILAVTRLLLMVNNPLSKDEFLSMLQPKSTNPSGAGVSEKTIDAAVECGLIERKDDLYMLATNILPKETKPEDLDSCLPRLLAKLLLQPKIGDSDNGFAILCAWLLHQQVDKMPPDRGGLKNALQTQGLSLDRLQVKNDARWDNVIYWARYLGLLHQIGDEPCSRLVPDPSVFLQRHLHELLPDNREVVFSDFIVRVGSICPVLDGGVVRANLLRQIEPDWQKNQISDALAFGLERLEKSGNLRLWCPDDARTFMLTPTQRKIAFVAHSKVS